MKKPIEIINLEKELNIGEATLVGVEEIIKWSEKDYFYYSLNDKREVNGIRIQGQGLKEIPDLNAFFELEILHLSKNQLSKIEGLGGLTKLERLFLSNNQLIKMEGLDGLTNLTHLSLGSNQLNKIEGLGGLTKLTQLYFDNNHLIKIEGLNGLTNLIKLSLSGNQIIKIEGLDGLAKLNWLRLDNNQLSKSEGLDCLTKLTQLYFDNNQLIKIEGLNGLTNLIKLSLSGNQIIKIEGLDGLAKLNWLRLDNNQVGKMEGLDGLIKLTQLYLDNNQLRKIEGLDGLTKLRTLFLSANQLTSIEGLKPIINNLVLLYIHCDSLATSEKYKDLILTDPKTKEPLSGEQQLQKVKFWFKNQAEIKKAISLPTKVLLLGNSEVGKTGLRKYLLGKRGYMEKSDSTHIAEVFEWKYEPKSPKLIAKIWDFGGQDYYHSLHHLFFTKASLYLLLYDTKNPNNHQPEGQNHYNFNINYWLANLNHILGIDSKKDTEPEKIEYRKILIKNKIDDSDEMINIPKHLRVPKEFRISIVPDGKNTHPHFEFYKHGLAFLKASIIHELNQLNTKDNFTVLNKFQKIIDAIKKKSFVKTEEIFFTKTAFKKQSETLLKNKISSAEIDYLLPVLHNSGLLLNFNTMPDKIWLYPEDLIVKIHEKLDKNATFEKNEGKLKSEEAQKLLKENDLKSLLLEQEVIFIEDKNETKEEAYYIFPQFLPISKKSNSNNALYAIAKSNLKPAFTLRFKYFLPTSFMSRVICRFGTYPGIKHYERYELIFTEEIKINDTEEKIRVWIVTDLCKLKVAVHISELSTEKNQETYLTYLFNALMIAYYGRGKHLNYKTYAEGLNYKGKSEAELLVQELHGLRLQKGEHNEEELKMSKRLMEETGQKAKSTKLSKKKMDLVKQVNANKPKPLPEMWKDEKMLIPSDLYIEYNDYQVSYAQLNKNKEELFTQAESSSETEPKKEQGDTTKEENKKSHQYTIHKSQFRPFFKGEIKNPLKIFISYAHKNYGYLERLEVHLAGLQRLGIIEQWNDTKFKIGDKWDAKIKAKLKAADLVILLVSADFINSAYIQNTEIEIIEKKDKKKIMPIIVQDCFWEDQTYLSDVVVYPRVIKVENGNKELETVLPLEEYKPASKAYKEIVKQIKSIHASSR